MIEDSGKQLRECLRVGEHVVPVLRPSRVAVRAREQADTLGDVRDNLSTICWGFLPIRDVFGPLYRQPSER